MVPPPSHGDLITAEPGERRCARSPRGCSAVFHRDAISFLGCSHSLASPSPLATLPVSSDLSFPVCLEAPVPFAVSVQRCSDFMLSWTGSSTYHLQPTGFKAHASLSASLPAFTRLPVLAAHRPLLFHTPEWIPSPVCPSSVDGTAQLPGQGPRRQP